MAVTLVEKYNPIWPEWFQEIKSFLGDRISDSCKRIEHVGSTSIPGMIAKPIIDFIIVIEKGSFPKMKKLLEERGYFHKGDQGIQGREVFKLTDESLKKAPPEHHLYVCVEDNQELNREIAFRDYLKVHEEDIKRLSNLKWSLAENFNNNKYPYMDGKDAMVKEITRKAIEYLESSKAIPHRGH